MNFFKSRRIYAFALTLLLLAATGCQQTGTQREANGQGGSTSTPLPTVSPTVSTAPAGTPVAVDPGKTENGTKSPSPEPTSTSGGDAKPLMAKVTALRSIDAKSAWIGGEGWIARSDDGGQSWKLQYQGEQTVKQLFALNGKEAWVVFAEDAGQQNGDRLLHTIDGGMHWSPVGRMPNNAFLHFTSSLTGFAANAATTDGGRTWTKLPVPGDIVGSAYFHDSKHGWAVSPNKSDLKILRTVDGGKSWQTALRKQAYEPAGTLIRSAGNEDVWVEIIGDSGMTQTSYSLFHTTDGGKHWITSIAHSTAGAGPAPGFANGYNDGPDIDGSGPGPFYAASTKVAAAAGYCAACDKPNTVAWTTDGGKSWIKGKQAFPGYGRALLAVADQKHAWLICTDYSLPSSLYITSDGGEHWRSVFTFAKPKHQ